MTITRRNFLRRSAIGILGAVGVPVSITSSCAISGNPGKRPNIVMYISDDHGIDFLGCYGNKDIKTPNIDALAKEGVLFSGMFAASPTCAPSRSVLWTGLYPARNGCMGNHTVCRDDVTSLPT